MKHDICTVKKAIKGDVNAFETLLFKEEKILYYKALSLVGSKEDAFDAIQETSYKAFLSIGKLRNPEFFSTWLIKILIRECYTLLKNRERILYYEESELLRRMEHNQGDFIESFHLSEALSLLNSSNQTAIILFYYHDLSIKDISVVMGRPISTIKTYLRRAKKILKAELERRYQLDERIT